MCFLSTTFARTCVAALCMCFIRPCPCVVAHDFRDQTRVVSCPSSPRRCFDSISLAIPVVSAYSSASAELGLNDYLCSWLSRQRHVSPKFVLSCCCRFLGNLNLLRCYAVRASVRSQETLCTQDSFSSGEHCASRASRRSRCCSNIIDADTFLSRCA